MSSILDKIKELGYELPVAPKPIASYVTAIKIDNLVFTSGALPMLNGELKFKKEVGGLFNKAEYGYEAAKLCVLNALSVINDLVGLDSIEQIVKVTGFVNSAKGFIEQPKVINGASDMLVEIFGEQGKHARSAVGVSELPMDASVELEMIVKIK